MSDTETYVSRRTPGAWAVMPAETCALSLPRSIAKELADWLIHNNVVEHIFGPNLHIEVRGDVAP